QCHPHERDSLLFLRPPLRGTRHAERDELHPEGCRGVPGARRKDSCARRGRDLVTGGGQRGLAPSQARRARRRRGVDDYSILTRRRRGRSAGRNRSSFSAGGGGGGGARTAFASGLPDWLRGAIFCRRVSIFRTSLTCPCESTTRRYSWPRSPGGSTIFSSSKPSGAVPPSAAVKMRRTGLVSSSRASTAEATEDPSPPCFSLGATTMLA